MRFSFQVCFISERNVWRSKRVFKKEIKCQGFSNCSSSAGGGARDKKANLTLKTQPKAEKRWRWWWWWGWWGGVGRGGLSFQSWTHNRVRCSLGLRCQATAKGPPWESFDFLNNQMKGETRGPKGIKIGYLRRRLNTICGYSWAGGKNGGKHLEEGKLLCNGRESKAL